MSSTVIEIRKNNGQIQYSVEKSGDSELDKLAEVGIGSINMFMKSGGNMQNLLSNMGGGLKQQLMGLLGGGMGGMPPMGGVPGNGML